MWCTLQEAYNVPSFDQGRRKGGKCGGFTADAKVSAEPYDPFRPGGKRGEQTKYGGNVEGFTGTGDLQRRSYKGEQQDKDYFCSQYGICPLGAKKQSEPVLALERFENASPSAAPAPGPVRTISAQMSCKGLDVPVYTTPINPQANASYEQAIRTNLESQPQTWEGPARMSARVVNMDQVSGYVDEDLDQYLTTNDLRAAKTQMPSLASNAASMVPATLPKALSTPVASSNTSAAASSVAATSSSTLAASSKTSLTTLPIMDILLFILAGILLIFLCDQLFKVALMLGMRHTVEILEPFLKRL